MPSITGPIAAIGSAIGGAGAAVGASGLAGPLLGAAGSIGGALISSNGANSAAQTQANAANQAAQTQLQMYNQTRSDLSPFTSTGASAMSQLASLFGFGPGGTGTPNAAAATSALTQFPGYQFGQQQGMQALDRSAASKGLLLSGGQLKDATQFGTNYAMQQAWQPYVSTLSDFSRLGESAAAQVGSAGTQAGQGIAASQLAAGQATASGQAANANIWGQALQGGAGQIGSAVSNWWPGGGGTGTTMTAANMPASQSSIWDGLF